MGKYYDGSLQLSLAQNNHFLPWMPHLVNRKFEGMSTLVRNMPKLTKLDDTTVQKEKEESASLSFYAISVYIPAVTPSPPYWTTANYQNPHGCTISDISSMLHTKDWTKLQWPALFHTENKHVLHTRLGSGSKPNNWMTFSSSLSHTYSFPSRAAVPLPFSQTFIGLSMLHEPLVFMKLTGSTNLLLSFC